MATITIMRTYFQVVINVSEETARNIIDKWLDDFDSLVEWTKAETENLCTNIRCPGGMIINPRAIITEKHTTIRDPGYLISMVAEKRLLMNAYAAMNQACTLRPIDSQSITRAFIMSLAPLR